ncbi:MAG: hypothetical protein ACFFCI_14020 [Promethearchaeota archaeon]
MKKKVSKIVLGFLFVNFLLLSVLPILNSYGAITEITPKFGEAPVIDGFIDDSTKEWKNAVKEEINLGDLPIDLWVMQHGENLYISVQINLEVSAHNLTEFIGLLISNSSSENKEDFIDAKIIQFTNISTDSFMYLDDYINDSIFLNDTVQNGEGAGGLEEKVSIYEFSIPILQPKTNIQDAALNYDESYAFNITYGDLPFYPQGIKKSGIVLIDINSPSVGEEDVTEMVLLIISIVVFSVIGVLFVFYIYQIFKLKEKMQRLRS